MQCPHCLCEYDVKPHVFSLGQDQDGTWQVKSTRCPTCDRLIVDFCTDDGCVYPGRPALSSRPRLSEDVPSELAREYHTAAQVVHFSAEASAAISRRLLHQFLAAYVHVEGAGLAERLSAAVESPELPPYLKEALDTLCELAKLGHDEPKSTHPGLLTGVERGEAEWLLDILDQLFELYFVQPARLQRRRVRLEGQVGPLVATAAATLEAAGSEEPAEPAEPAEVGEEADAQSAAEEAPEQGGTGEATSAADAAAPDAAAAAPDASQPVADTQPVAETQPATETQRAAKPAVAAPQAEPERGGWRRRTGR